jgi:hypothetical protein
MHILSFLVVLGVLALALGVIGAMLLGNRARIVSALRGEDVWQVQPVARRTPPRARRSVTVRMAANGRAKPVALAA